LKLRPYQDEAADFIYEHDRAMVLAPVGAGKTAITITAMDAMWESGLMGNERWLVLAPKRVCTDVWPQEIQKWAKHLKATVSLGTPAQRMAALADPAKTGANVVIFSYDNLQWLADVITAKGTRESTLRDAGFVGVVFDELTRLKNPSGKRFKALETILNGVKFRWGLTGSFTSNGLEDTFGQCKIVDQSLLGRSKGAFLQQYFVCINRDYGEWAPRKGALEQVMQRIKPATYLLEPGEYSDTLPPLHTVELRCDLPDRQPYEKMKRDFVVDFPNAKAIAVNAAVVTGKLQQMANGFVYETTVTPSHVPGKFVSTKTPHWFSEHKFEMLDDLIAENQRANMIIVYNFQEELAELERRYPQAKTIDSPGGIKAWNEGKVELLLIHPKSAGHGLNLQHGGCRIAFLSLPWSLELYEQTVGRLHRSGQRHDVWCYVLLTNKTIDEKIWAALHDKRALSDIALEELK